MCPNFCSLLAIYLQINKTSKDFEIFNDLFTKMVLLTNYLSGTTKGVQKWIDSLRVICKGGHGGNGFPKYGGNGGQGGSVIIRVVSDLDSRKVKKKSGDINLTNIFKKEFKSDPKKQRLIGKNGKDSSKMSIFGESGEDKILTVILSIKLIRKI